MTEIKEYKEGEEMITGVIYRNAPRWGHERKSYAKMWLNVKDGDTLIAGSLREADNIYTSFYTFQKKNPQYQSFRLRRKAMKDGRVKLFFDDLYSEKSDVQVEWGKNRFTSE